MVNVTDEIRKYIQEHNYNVSMRKVIKYILETKKINTTEAYIRNTVNTVLIQLGGTLKPESLREIIEDYVKKHNNKVTNSEVEKYILEKKKIKTTKSSIRVTLNRVLNKLGGSLKPAGIKEKIKAYVEKHKNKVSDKEVIEYILKKEKIQVSEEYIKKVLREVLVELEGTLKPPKKASYKNNCKKEC